MQYERKISLPIDPVYKFFVELPGPKTKENEDKMMCILCKRIMKTTKGNKTGLMKHVAFHKKKGENKDREAQKRFMITHLVAEQNVSFRFFNSMGVRKLFRLAGLGVVNEKIASKCIDEEATWVVSTVISFYAEILFRPS